LVVAPDPVAGLPRIAVEHLVKNPLIAVDSPLNATSLVADVVFPWAIVGIEIEGTAYRARVPRVGFEPKTSGDITRAIFPFFFGAASVNMAVAQ
jgi:formylmethanofuran dehydrogenase subunit B